MTTTIEILHAELLRHDDRNDLVSAKKIAQRLIKTVETVGLAPYGHSSARQYRTYLMDRFGVTIQ